MFQPVDCKTESRVTWFTPATIRWPRPVTWSRLGLFGSAIPQGRGSLEAEPRRDDRVELAGLFGCVLDDVFEIH